MKNFFTIFLAITILLTAVYTKHATEETIKNVQNICLSYNTCKDTSQLNCKCDYECSVYGDCCLDSSFLHLTKIYQLQAECINNYYFISKCPSWWNYETVKRNCETEINLKDSKSFLKVFSLYTLLTYKNYYCAICNEDAEKLYWWPRIECFRSGRLFHVDLNKLYYDQYFSSWGMYDPYYSFWGQQQTTQRETPFIPCTIYNEPRANLKDFSFRKCTFSISKCADNWKDEVIREKCNEFQGIVYVDSVPYRNVYCALCNWFHIEEISCDKDATGVMAKAGGGISITDLFILDLPKCKNGYIYDSNNDICRKIFCLPFQVLVKNKCVPKKKNSH